MSGGPVPEEVRAVVSDVGPVGHVVLREGTDTTGNVAHVRILDALADAIWELGSGFRMERTETKVSLGVIECSGTTRAGEKLNFTIRVQHHSETEVAL